ncbi:unnamed protein product [Rotaria magnacalcarata]|uniref:5'-AMP-activated protein kinase subunit beta-1 n=1 Tax=Rotaria magnacalcarata TaxID=392030 RepID=A0A814DEQ7_9BILA|nr:unnamed protein product [Rotaria magnacalcarata]
MGNQQPTARTRGDIYSQYERDAEDGRFMTLDSESSMHTNTSSLEERVPLRQDPSLPIRIRYQRQMQQYLTQVPESMPEGRHEYKFFIDGRWEYDLNEPSVDDSHSGRNNVVTVKKSDFEVMEALTLDSMAASSSQSSSINKQKPNHPEMARSPPGLYDHTWPPANREEFSPTDKPPFLPPHLLNIILNQDTAAHYEPALLPEPNHVMLKHLYALSIRDGVMVLSTTARYKQKFVTTCFYKPTA